MTIEEWQARMKGCQVLVSFRTAEPRQDDFGRRSSLILSDCARRSRRRNSKRFERKVPPAGWSSNHSQRDQAAVDAPNGWAPLQWLTVQGLRNYGQEALARDIAERWIRLNVKVFKDTGKLMEKYDVQDIGKLFK